MRAALVLASFGAACGPEVATNDGGAASSDASSGADASGSTITEPQSESSSTEGGAESSSSSVDTSTSDDTGSSWGEPELLAELAGDPNMLTPQYVVVATDHVHVGSVIGAAQSRHWVLDRSSGEVIATSPAAGALAVTTESVYSAGYRNGALLDGEYALVRMNHDGTDETELFVAAEAPHVYAASTSRAFVEIWPDYDHFETWVVDDGLPGVELLVDTDQQSMGYAIHRDGALLAPVFDDDAVVSLDLATLAFAPLLELPAPPSVLGSAADFLLVGTEDGLFRAQEDRLDPTAVDTALVGALTADEDLIVWLAADDSLVLKSTPTAGGDVEVLALEGQLVGARKLALAPDALYILAYAVDTTTYAGTVWKLDRPR